LYNKALGFLPHLFVDVLLALVVTVLTAGLQVELVHAPVLQVLGEGQHTEFLDKVQLSRPIEIQDRGKRSFEIIQGTRRYNIKFKVLLKC